jgi:crotonobetainyl-CoA:carnitine CoA-transferase CaiB-like acyl-CoA transferase
MNSAILNGIRVLDFSRVLAGPYATRILADYGAEVIKVQSQKTATGTDLNTGRYFSNWNRNKKSITLDMSCPEARALALKLAAISDVVVENFSPRVMANWRLDYAALKKANPALILVSISAMGQTGPWRDFVAYGSTVQALGGLTYLTAYDENAPLGPGYAYADTIAGLYGALAVLAALEFRENTGRGQHIDLSEYEAVCTLIGPALMDALVNDAQVLPGGNQPDYSMAAPHGCYRCRGEDKWYVIAVFTEAEWQALVKVLGSPAWAEADRFSTISKRRDHSEELDENLERWTSKRRAEEVVAQLQAAGVPAGIVQNAEDLANDPHLLERDWFVKLPHPTLGENVSDRSPIRLSQSSTSNWKSSPLLGEDNRYVYTELIGLTDQQFSSYVEKGIIA